MAQKQSILQIKPKRFIIWKITKTQLKNATLQYSSMLRLHSTITSEGTPSLR